ncbi:ubiquitin carboxyl-terminal hydrolase 42-like protein [Pitangus sulphuratus]|nr:ubiquitin carboxyl-terminal hydrolase 42-like protein [Pitangus sulphuratus]
MAPCWCQQWCGQEDQGSDCPPMLGTVIAKGMALPQRILFPPEKICMDWQQRQRPGAGLLNLGNTCYINVILQCLTYTPPLANYLLSHEHSQSCQQQGFCMMCIMEVHIRKVLHSSASAILPGAVLRDLKFTCLNCQAVTDSYKAFLDVSLDIRFVDYPEYLDLRPYMSDTAGEPLLCSLYAIVVHSGDTCLEGHFFCYTKASNGLWYKMDDESVDSCDTHTVLGQQAYLLFYARGPLDFYHQTKDLCLIWYHLDQSQDETLVLEYRSRPDLDLA